MTVQSDTVVGLIRRAVEQLGGVLDGTTPNASQALFASDCLGFGPRRDDAAVGSASVAEALGRWGRASGQSSFRIVFPPTQIHIAVANGGQSGWLWAFPRLDVPGMDDGTVARHWRLTALVGKGADAAWRFHHVHFSRGMPNEDLSGYADQLQPLKGLGEGVGPGADVLVPLLSNNLGVGMVELVARGSDTVIIGTDPGEVFEGSESWLSVVEPMADQLRQLESSLTHVFSGGIRAGLTPDGQSGVVATNVSLDYGGGPLPPFRVGWIFTRVDGAFRLVCDHHSIGWPPVG